MIQVIGRCECVQASSWDETEIWKLYFCEFINCQSTDFKLLLSSLIPLSRWFFLPALYHPLCIAVTTYLTFPFLSISFLYLILLSPCRLLHPTRAPPMLYGRHHVPPSPSTSPVPLTPHAAPIPRKPLQTASAIKDHSQSARQSARQPVRQPVSEPSALT